MKVLVLSNGELKIKEIENTLENLQEIVGGYIEMPYLSKVFADNCIDIIINEEGKFIEGLKPEIAVIGNDGKVLDIVYGNCIFVSHDKNGETIELNNKQIKIVMEKLAMDVVLKGAEEKFIVKGLVV